MLTAGTRANRLLLFALVVMTVIPSLLWLIPRFLLSPIGADVDIPLRATERWLSGAEPYLRHSFAVTFGRDLPFLYPPFVLPFLAPLTLVPRGLVLVAGVAVNLAAATAICRMLAIPRAFWPLVLCWPPLIEGIWAANVQVLIVAMFLLIFWGGPPLGAWRPRPRTPFEVGARPTRYGSLAAVIAAIKVSQVHPWLLVSRDSPQSALRGALVIGFVILATVAVTGVDPYRAWLDQAGLASDPAWFAAGTPISKIFGRVPALAVAGLSLPVVFLLPRLVGRTMAPVWVGLLVILAAPNLHPYYFLFMLPAMLVIRRELGLVAAFLLAINWPGLEWVAFAVVVGSLALGSVWQGFWEATEAGNPPDGSRLVPSGLARATARR